MTLPEEHILDRSRLNFIQLGLQIIRLYPLQEHMCSQECISLRNIFWTGVDAISYSAVSKYAVLDALLATSTKMLGFESFSAGHWSIVDAQNGASELILAYIWPALVVRWTPKADKIVENDVKVMLENNTQQIKLQKGQLSTLKDAQK